MKICLVNLDFIPYRSSGLAVYGETLALGLAAAGHKVVVVSAQRPGLAAHEWHNQIEIYRVPLGPADWISYAWRAGPLVARLRETYAFDVIHFLDGHFAYRYRGPFVASLFQSFRQRVTSDGGWPYHSNWRSLIVRLLYYNAARWLAEAPTVRRANRLIAASQAAAEEFVTYYGIPRERVTVVPLGIDLQRFYPRNTAALRHQLGLEDMTVLLYVGFCTPRKGLEYLARALHRLPDTVKVLIIGRWESSYRAKVYRALGKAADRFIELGYVSDAELPAYYALADLFVFPSLLEGFGLPIAEALACETPVVTTRAESIPEVIGPGGRIVPPRDVDALAEAIAELAGDMALRRRLGRAGRQWVLAHFNQRRMVERYLAAYEHRTGVERDLW
jgi:glycosyltransferase involved in cell wall biosynthesis